MTHDEAKTILSAARPEARTPDDPAFAEALAFVERDPALAAWWEEMQALDRRLADALGAVQPPADLQATLLAIRPARAEETRRNFMGKLLALAAAGVLGAGVLWRQRESEPEPDLIAVAREALAEGPRLALESAEVAPLRAWLAAQGSPLPTELPRGLAGRKSAGCQTYEHAGHRISLICFWLDLERLVHLFTAENPARRIAAVELQQEGPMAMLRWAGVERSYLLAGTIPPDELRALV